MQPALIRLSTDNVELVDDPLLEVLEDQRAGGDADRLRSSSSESDRNETKEAPRDETDDPFDIEIAQPRAIDLRKLYQQLDLKLPADIVATLGAKRPILLCHGMTPFYKAGRRPTGIWGMGYQATPKKVNAATVSFLPESMLLEVANVDQRLNFGLEVGGAFAVPEEALQLVSEVPGLSLTGASLHATTDQKFGLCLKCRFSVLEVQAGPVDAGGVRWNLYRSTDRIDIHQPLFQTLLVPEEANALEFAVEPWIRRSGRYFGLVKARHWKYSATMCTVPLT